MARYERSRKRSHVDTVHYEIDMLEYALQRLNTPDPPPPELNMTLECFLLHYRNLIEFFSGAKHRKNYVSVAKPEVWCHRQINPDDLASLVPSSRKSFDKYWTDVSQFLQHCTERRFPEAKDWNPQ